MTILTYLLTFAAAAAPAAEDKPAVESNVTSDVVMFVTADEADAAKDAEIRVVRVLATSDGEDADTQKNTFVWKAGDGADCNVATKVITTVAAGDSDRGWLGIALGTISEETAEENDLAEDTGIVVLNVVKGSPAEEAGLEQNDVITHINGESINSVADLAKRVRHLGPGANIEMTVVREGKASTRTAQLDSPASGEIEWIYEHTPNVFIKEFRRPGAVMRLDPHGKIWTCDPDEIGNAFQHMPDHVAEMLNQFGMSRSVSVNRDDKRLELKSNQDGDVVEISQDGSGPITVTRYHEGESDRQVEEYANDDELRAHDPDAFALYHRSQHHDIDFNISANPFQFKFSIDEDDEVSERIEEALAQAHERMQQAGKIRAQLSFPDLQGGKVTHSFKTQPDGTIELTLRKGDTEVINVYRDEADLEARNPAAYDKYADILESAEE